MHVYQELTYQSSWLPRWFGFDNESFGQYTKLQDEHGFGVLYSLLTATNRSELASLLTATFKMLFLFGYKQAEELAILRDPTRGTFNRTVSEIFQELIPRIEKQEEYSIRFMKRLGDLQRVGGNIDQVLMAGTDIFKSPRNLVTWMRTRMPYEYKIYRDSSTHSGVPGRAKVRDPVLADAFLVLDLVMYGNDGKLMIKY